MNVDKVSKFQKDQTNYIPSFTQDFFFLVKNQKTKKTMIPKELYFVAPGIFSQ